LEFIVSILLLHVRDLVACLGFDYNAYCMGKNKNEAQKVGSV